MELICLVDKETLEARVKWVEDNEKYIIQTAEDPHNNYEFWAHCSNQYNS